MEECENNCRFRQSHIFLCSAGVNTIPIYDFLHCIRKSFPSIILEVR